MKAKDLAELLLKNPHLNVVIEDSEWGIDTVNEVRLARFFTTNGNKETADDEVITNMRASIASFDADELPKTYAELVKGCKASGLNPISMWGPLEHFVKEQTLFHESEKQRLAIIEAAPYCLMIA